MAAEAGGDNEDRAYCWQVLRSGSSPAMKSQAAARLAELDGRDEYDLIVKAATPSWTEWIKAIRQE